METIEVVKWQEGVNLKNLSRKNIFDSIQEIDHGVYHENELGTEQSISARYEAYKDSYIFALREGKIVGYLCYFPITSKFYNSVITGEKVYDDNITSTDICNLNSISNYIFIISVAILPKYQKNGISKQFSKILLEELSKIKIKDIVSFAFTVNGAHFLNAIGLNTYKEMEDKIKLMRLYKGFDLVLAIPCETVKNNKRKPGNTLDTALLTLENFVNSSVKCGNTEKMIENVIYDNKSNLLNYAKIFCEQIKEHSDYELIFNNEDNNIKIERMPLLFGQVILYKDEKTNKFNPKCCYNFFCICSELTIFDTFNIIYFVVPDIKYQDLTLLMDQSHKIWCNINGENRYDSDNLIILTDYLANIGYKYLEKIYHIVFSDLNQFKIITDNGGNNNKIFNILAAEAYKEDFFHQIELSENTDEYIILSQGNTKDIRLTKKERFFASFNMYSSYDAYASLYTYYFVIKDVYNKKDIFYDRIAPDETDEGFSSEANVLFILEIEIFKITAGLVLSKRINEQINNPNMKAIQEMYKSFINSRPLFEKLNYRYLGAQKVADFIYDQFRIGDIIADYDHKKELLRNYSEVTNSIITNNNSKILQFIGMIFTFISGFSMLSHISAILFDDETILEWEMDFIIPSIIFGIILLLFIPKPKKLKNYILRILIKLKKSCKRN
jgi:GNAT superfamily N-acetyltransferase